MTAGPFSAAMAQLGHSVRPPNSQPDEALVGAFVRDRDEEAAAELVRRHGPMVYGVCRRLHAAEADDAFQAVWLVFSRSAGRVRPPGAVGPWLHGVAVKVASKARTQCLSRRRRLMASSRPETIFDPPTDPLLTAVLDEELARLPDKYRLPVLLCDLGGKTRVEAAAELGWPEGTVATRLIQGRERLAARLRRRGVVLPMVGLATVLTAQATAAKVPAALSLSAVQILVGTTAVSPAILPLAESAGASMTQKSVILAAIGLLAVLGVTAVGLGFTGWADGAKPAALVAVAGETTHATWRLKSVRKDHGQMVYDAAFSPNGKTFTTTGADGNVIVWETATQAIRQKIEVVKNLPPPGPAVAPTFDPLKGPQTVNDPNQRLAGGTPPAISVRYFSDDELGVWYIGLDGLPAFGRFDAASGKLVSADMEVNESQSVIGRSENWSVRFPDGSEVKLNVPNRRGNVPGFDGILGGVLSPDREWVALARWSPETGSSLTMCDAKTGKVIVERNLFGTDAAPATKLAFSADNRQLAVTTIGGRFAMFAAPDWTESYRRDDPLVRSADDLTFTPDGKQLLSAGWREEHVKNWFGLQRSNIVQREVWVRDAATGALVQSLPVRPPTKLTAANSAVVAGVGLNVCKLVVSPDGRTLVATLGSPNSGKAMESAGEQAAKATAGEVRVYVRGEVNPATQPPKVEEKPNPNEEVERNQDLWVWQPRLPVDKAGRVGSVAFTADGRNLLTGSDGSVTMWRLFESPPKTQWSKRLATFDTGVTVATAPNSRVVAGINEKLFWLDSATGMDMLDPGETFANANPRAIAFSPNGKRVALTDGRKLTVKDIGAPGEVSFGPLDDSTLGPAAVSWAPDGKRLVFLPNVKVDPTWPGNGAKQPDAKKATHFIAQVWGAGSGEPMVLLKHGPARLTSAAWSADGKRIITADDAGEIVIWDGETFQERKRLKLTGPVRAITIRADGKRFAVGVHVQDPGKTDVRVTPPWSDRIEMYSQWESDNWQSSSKLELPSGQSLNVIAFAPDGKALVAGTAKGLHIWDRVKLAPK